MGGIIDELKFLIMSDIVRENLVTKVRVNGSIERIIMTNDGANKSIVRRIIGMVM